MKKTNVGTGLVIVGTFNVYLEQQVTVLVNAIAGPNTSNLIHI